MKLFCEASAPTSAARSRSPKHKTLDHRAVNPLASENPISRGARIRALFDSLDDDKTGYLEAGNITRRFDELALGNGTCASTTLIGDGGKDDASERPEGPLGSSIMYARELVKECDKTKDGRITFAEFDQFIKQKELELWHLFQQIDRGGDNVIQPSELKGALRAAGMFRFVFFIVLKLQDS
ncbi:hypothetical protein HK104_000326 [Borealophlyctis nickersoniae]|nr:hypothetical protein HK104_000326 [Borealophlyctis nickersoniae]